PSPSSFELVERGELSQVSILSAVANLPGHIKTRQAKRAYNRLAEEGIHARTDMVSAPSRGPGTCLFVLAEYQAGDHLIPAGFTGYGARGKPAEKVADEAVDAFLRYHASGAPVDPHLADQLILPLALARCQARFRTSRVTQHLLTNIWVVEQFLGSRFTIEGEEGEEGTLTCSN
ncbi:MAG TPA: RNA 3'-phosphate cyclase, partial [Anaerolineae bacterium]|nr:RNA 3'-phosphate cyclase [Anaerolineae bacterium]